MNVVERTLLHDAPLVFLERMREYCSLEVEGIEQIPRRGRAMIVPNHSGYAGLDALLLSYEIMRARRRIARMMAHRLFFSQWWIAQLWPKYGLFPARFKAALHHLGKNRAVVVFPEAEHGTFKPSINMYHLQHFDPGFARLAIITQSPIIPAIIIGAEETHLNLASTDLLKPWLGIELPIPLNIFPRRAKWKIKFLKPIELRRYTDHDVDNEALMEEIAQNIRIQVQHGINQELRGRDVITF